MWLCFCVALCVAWGTSLWFYLRVAPLDMCDMIHAYVRHDSFICVTGLIQICDMTHWSVWRDSCVWHGSECDVIHVCDTWMMSEWMMNDECDVIHVCDMAHIWCVWHGSYLMCVTWLISETHCNTLLHTASRDSCVWHGSYLMCVTWLISEADATDATGLCAWPIYWRCFGITPGPLLQCLVCCSVLQFWCAFIGGVWVTHGLLLQSVGFWCNVLQCVAVWCVFVGGACTYVCLYVCIYVSIYS